MFRSLSVRPDPVLITLLFNACARLLTAEAMSFGMRTLRHYRKETFFFAHQRLFNSALDMLMKFNQIEQAEELFAARTNRTDPTSFAVMMNGYYINQQTQDCLKLFDSLQKSKIPINDSIAVPLVSAAAQMGLLSICHRISKEIRLEEKTDLRVKNVLIDMWVRQCS